MFCLIYVHPHPSSSCYKCKLLQNLEFTSFIITQSDNNNIRSNTLQSVLQKDTMLLDNSSSHVLYVAITGWSHYTIQVNGRSSNSSYNNTASTYQFSQLCRCRTNRHTDKQIPYTRYFSRILYFADNLSGRIFAFKFSLMAYL